MAVECHICYEAIAQGQKALSLNCGHVCCAICLEKWLESSDQDEKYCPVCRYLPEPGEAPRHVFLRFAEGNAPRTRTLVNLEDAIKNGEGFKSLISGLANAENLTAHELQTMLDDALQVHAAMQDLCRVRELQEVMSDISLYLVAIQDDFPQFQDKLEMAKRELDDQKLVEVELRFKIEQKEKEARSLGAALRDQEQVYEDQLEASRQTIALLREEKRGLETTYQVERKSLQDELELSEQSITELDATVNKIKASKIAETPINGSTASKVIDERPRENVSARAKPTSKMDSPLIPDIEVPQQPSWGASIAEPPKPAINVTEAADIWFLINEPPNPLVRLPQSASDSPNNIEQLVELPR